MADSTKVVINSDQPPEVPVDASDEPSAGDKPSSSAARPTPNATGDLDEEGRFETVFRQHKIIWTVSLESYRYSLSHSSLVVVLTSIFADVLGCSFCLG